MWRRKNKLKRKLFLIKKITKNFYKQHKKLFWVTFFIVSSFFITKITYNHYINNPKNIIKHVYFDKQLINNPNFSKLVSFTQEIFSWQNSIKGNFFKFKSQKLKIKEAFPFVKNIKIEVLNPNSIKVSFDFTPPYLYFIGSGYVFGLYNEKNIIKFDPKYLTWSMLINKKVFLPDYLQNLDNLSWIFYKTNFNQFLKYYETLQKYFSGAKIVYLAWWEYFQIITGWKNYLISLDKDINLQIKQLNLLKKKVPDKFKNSIQIDLWSLKNKIFLKEKTK